MTTLQEYLDSKFPTKEEKEQVEKISVRIINRERKEKGLAVLKLEKLDCREYVNLEQINIEGCFSNFKLTELNLGDKPKLTKLYCDVNQLTNLDLSGCPSLNLLACDNNRLTSVDFLIQLPNPEKLARLIIHNNNIQPTDIAFFNRFVNLRCLKLGTMEVSLSKEGRHNKFFGSFQSWKDLTKLYKICIEATDVNDGLEYLPFSLANSTNIESQENKDKEKGGYIKIECSPHDTAAKCSAIEEQLCPFNYDLLAWQLAHPELMLKTRPEYFTNSESNEQWLTALKNKIQKVKEQITTERDIHQEVMKIMDDWYHQLPPHDNNLKNILTKFADDYLKLSRENRQKDQKIKEMEQNIETINKILEKKYLPKETKEQGTQTELTGQDYEQQQKSIKQLEEVEELMIEKIILNNA